MGTLYVVATPIGNLEDITLRALRILKEVDAIVCEDTRVTGKLLAKYEISKPLVSFHSHSGDVKSEKILAMLEEGQTLALVTDAGTPAISDPGAILVARAIESGARVETIPGASALSAAASIAGFPVSDFLFLGFLPHKKGRETLFKEIAASDRTVILYESPHRLMKTLAELERFTPERQIAVCRELTKIHEEVVRGLPSEVAAHYSAHPDTVRGEIVILVSTLSKNSEDGVQ